MSDAIVIEGLTKRFGRREAVKDLWLSIRTAEVFGLVGPNGAGKTTLTRMLCGVLTPTSGRAWVGGYDIVRQSELVKRSIGYVAQKFSLYPDLPVSENLDFCADVYGVRASDARERKRELLGVCGLDHLQDQVAGNLSGGLKRRLALACALIHRPTILFLEGPTTGIDPVARRVLWDLLFTLAQQGTTLFVTTHYMDEAERCTQVGYIYEGRLLVSGDPNAMKREEIAGTHRRIEIVCQPLMAALAVLRDAPYVDDVSVFGQALHVRIKDIPAEPPSPDSYASFATTARRAAVMDALRKRLLAAHVAVLSLHSVHPTLEDIFVSYTRRMEDLRRRNEATSAPGGASTAA